MRRQLCAAHLAAGPTVPPRRAMRGWQRVRTPGEIRGNRTILGSVGGTNEEVADSGCARGAGLA